jgi:hypothetical protein
MLLKDAKLIAINICHKLHPYCDRINIAGSIRRKKPEVKDIEIVCIPKQIEVDSEDLFGTKMTGNHIDICFVTAVDSLGVIEKGNTSGRYMKIVLPQGIYLMTTIGNMLYVQAVQIIHLRL